MFLMYQEELGIESLLSNVDWRGVLPRQAYYAVLNRHPENRSVSVPSENYSPYDHFLDTLNSEEFQTYIPWLLLSAFPEKRRMIFIHIPKCAGSDLIGNLSARFPYINTSLSEPSWTGKAQLFSEIKNFVASCINADQIFLGGHVSLNLVLAMGAYRYGDALFTIMRDPVERILSAINYTIKILADDTGYLRPDRQLWTELLELRDVKNFGREEDLIHAARMMLHNINFIEPNVTCTYLGNGDFESAIDEIVRNNIEITDTSRYSSWLRSRWGMESMQSNTSIPLICKRHFSADDLHYISSITSQDQMLYDHLLHRLDKLEANSITGVEID